MHCWLLMRMMNKAQLILRYIFNCTSLPYFIQKPFRGSMLWNRCILLHCLQICRFFVLIYMIWRTYNKICLVLLIQTHNIVCIWFCSLMITNYWYSIWLSYWSVHMCRELSGHASYTWGRCTDAGDPMCTYNTCISVCIDVINMRILLTHLLAKSYIWDLIWNLTEIITIFRCNWWFSTFIKAIRHNAFHLGSFFSSMI